VTISNTNPSTVANLIYFALRSKLCSLFVPQGIKSKGSIEWYASYGVYCAGFCSLALTGISFQPMLAHDVYASEAYRELRATVSEVGSCEDILMNFVAQEISFYTEHPPSLVACTAHSNKVNTTPTAWRAPYDIYKFSHVRRSSYKSLASTTGRSRTACVTNFSAALGRSPNSTLSPGQLRKSMAVADTIVTSRDKSY
jgi:hypothetical protein